MILYFSATGNSEYVAKRIARTIGDEAVNLFPYLRSGEHPALTSEQPWVIVAPTYSWRMPRFLQGWLDGFPFPGDTDVYFVLTCGGSIGNAGAYLRRWCAHRRLSFRGCAQIVMPENYLALFSVPDPDEAKAIIERAEPSITEAARLIAAREPLAPKQIGIVDRLESGIVNDLFYPFVVRDKKFRATEACTACGTCENVCPLANVKLKGGIPTWSGTCTHCMACIARCPVSAIEYGDKTEGKPRYRCPARA